MPTALGEGVKGESAIPDECIPLQGLHSKKNIHIIMVHIPWAREIAVYSIWCENGKC
jgi:hypothetical protein